MSLTSLRLLGLLFLAGCAGTRAGSDKELLHLVVLHTNDLHGQTLPRAATWLDKENPPERGGLARLAGEIEASERELSEAGALVLVVDGGDWYQGTPEGLVGQGLDFTTMIGEMPYDAMCVGNHEFDFGVPHLAKLIQESEVPSILANVRMRESGQRVDWALPYRIVDFGNLRVALVGLLTVDTPSITHEDARDLDFVDPARELRVVMAELEALDGGVDLVIPVTHLGVNIDIELAAEHPELPLIVGGHSHSTLREGVRKGDTLIVQAGCKATVLGRVDLYLDPVTLEVVNSRAELIELAPDESRTNSALALACAELASLSAAEMATEVGVLSRRLGRSRGTVSSAAGNWITDIMRRRTSSDVAIQNRGGIRRDLEAGPVVRRDLFEILPFGNTLTTMELTGAELFATVESAITDKSHSGIEFSGMTAIWDKEGELTVLSDLLIAGVPVELTAKYQLATNSFLAGGGDRYLPESVTTRAKLDTGILLRDLCEEALGQGAGEVIPVENRYQEAGE
ncbi:MAG: bifunctional UDP-sugar hydrolase/5'-nucleotidase [Planctomycetota bacterium]|nr:bifunctional UDP-sugar hydrolase/5'-nucleotidase [Planctomycetota bacterium]